MLKGRPPTIYGDGRQSRDFTAVENIVEGNLLAADAPGVSGQVINLATGMGLSLLELVERINAAMGTHLEPVHEAARPGDILHSRASIDKARKLLNYVPVVDLDTGLARTIDWYRSHA
jgi:UDP-glucose 4-epimerase